MADLGMKSRLLSKCHLNLVEDAQCFFHFCRIFLSLPWPVRGHSQYATTGLSREDTVHHLTVPADAVLAPYPGVLDKMWQAVLYQQSDVLMPGPHRISCISSEAASCWLERRH